MLTDELLKVHPHSADTIGGFMEVEMQLATVIGTATSTIKHPSMAGWKLLVVQPLAAGEKPDGEPVLAIDNLGAGRGERVIITSDGKGTRAMMKSDNTPVRWSVLGISDEL